MTPYIEHPKAVAQIVLSWYMPVSDMPSFNPDFPVAVCAAFLHDVVEDTSITLQNLRMLGVDEAVIEVVDLLTKKNGRNDPEDTAYYQGVASNDTAVLVKFADRCHNLQDAAKDIRAEAGMLIPHEPTIRRWQRYAQRTRTDVLPIYASLQALHDELERRVKDVEAAVLEARGADPQGAFDFGATF